MRTHITVIIETGPSKPPYELFPYPKRIPRERIERSYQPTPEEVERFQRLAEVWRQQKTPPVVDHLISDNFWTLT